jgi:hypothetical protein
MLAALLLAAEMYTVKSGDTLYGIAGNAWPIVCADNHIADCNLIYPGQVLELNGSRAVTTSVVSLSNTAPEQSSDLGGTLGCSGLESLWESAGGSPSAAFMAAEIAMAESGGQQYATGGVGEEGYWQINPVNGDATYNPYGNARAAIYLSDDGTNWGPWTTYTEGLYIGRCL